MFSMVVSFGKYVQELITGINFSLSGNPPAKSHTVSFSRLFSRSFCDMVSCCFTYLEEKLGTSKSTAWYSEDSLKI